MSTDLARPHKASSPTTADQPKRLRVRGKLRTAIEYLVWNGDKTDF